MRVPGIFLGFLLLTWTFPASAAERIFEFGLVVCQQQTFAAPVVVMSNVASSELVVPVASLSMPSEASLPPYEGRPCADLLTDLTRSGYVLAASTPFSKRSPPPEEIFLRNKPSVTERLEWTIQLRDSVALLSCQPLVDAVASFADGAHAPDLHDSAGVFLRRVHGSATRAWRRDHHSPRGCAAGQHDSCRSRHRLRRL